MVDRPPAVLAEIRSLVETAARAGPPSRAVVEHLLTDGYAYALEVEARRLRIERRARELIREPEAGDARTRSDELAELTALLAEADRELLSVRALLSTLRAQAL